MTLTDAQRAFVESHPTAAMVTVGADGRPKVARVAVATIDGRLWSSGTADRVRTHRLRHDPRCTLFVFDAGFSWLATETRVRILDGDDAPQLNLQMFRALQQRPTGPLSWFGSELDEDAFLQRMRGEQRLIYEFEIERAYGVVG